MKEFIKTHQRKITYGILIFPYLTLLISIVSDVFLLPLFLFPCSLIGLLFLYKFDKYATSDGLFLLNRFGFLFAWTHLIMSILIILFLLLQIGAPASI